MKYRVGYLCGSRVYCTTHSRSPIMLCQDLCEWPPQDFSNMESTLAVQQVRGGSEVGGGRVRGEVGSKGGDE